MLKCDVLEPKIRNLGNLCLWNPESEKSLLVKSGVQEIFALESIIPCFWIHNPAPGVRNPVIYRGMQNPRLHGARICFHVTEHALYCDSAAVLATCNYPGKHIVF